MRKNRLLLGLTLVLLFSVMMSFYVTYAYEPNQTEIENRSINLNQQAMMGYSYDLYSYEVIYLHLSDFDQETVDLSFAEELKDSEIQLKTVDEVLLIIEQIKKNIISTIEIEYTTQRYGMMGGNSMGMYNNNYTSCGYPYLSDTYEWIYFHSSTEQRQILDLEFAETIMQMDLINLSVQEISEQINDYKQIVVDELINPTQINP